MSEGNTRFLDLDELGGEEIVTIKLNGKEHTLNEMTVEDFVWAQKQIKALEKAEKEGADDETIIERHCKILARQFPTAKVEEFRKLKISQLTKLLDFVTTLATDGAPQAVSDMNKAEEGKEQGKS